MLLAKYSSNWITQFQSIKQKLKTLLDCKFNIKHVGSTSIPNLDSKPIIDIDIIYFNEIDFETIKLNLEKIGYNYLGNQGILGREVFKQNNLGNDEVLDSITHHLYVCPYYSKALERHILLRNYLRKNEEAKLIYQTMKYNLAAIANQDKNYMQH